MCECSSSRLSYSNQRDVLVWSSLNRDLSPAECVWLDVKRAVCAQSLLKQFYKEERSKSAVFKYASLTETHSFSAVTDDITL